MTIDLITYTIHTYGIHGIYGKEAKMPGTTKKTKYYLDIEPELRNRVKAYAALKGVTMHDWLTEAIIAKLEDEVDASEGLAAFADKAGTMSLENYIQTRQGSPEQVR
jgi:hypothetical protein